MASDFMLSPVELFNVVEEVLKMSLINTKVPKSKADGEPEANRARPFVLIVLKALNKTRLRFNVNDPAGYGWWYRYLESFVDTCSLETELAVNHSVRVLVSGGIKCSRLQTDILHVQPPVKIERQQNVFLSLPRRQNAIGSTISATPDRLLLMKTLIDQWEPLGLHVCDRKG